MQIHMSLNKLQSDYESEPEMEGYKQQASAYCKGKIFVWCLAGWIYAGVMWYVFWIPGILIFFPGIFIYFALALIMPLEPLNGDAGEGD